MPENSKIRLAVVYARLQQMKKTKTQTLLKYQRKTWIKIIGAHHVPPCDSPSPYFFCSSWSLRTAQQVSGHPAPARLERSRRQSYREGATHRVLRRRRRRRGGKLTGSVGRCVSPYSNCTQPSAPTSRGVTSCLTHGAPLPNWLIWQIYIHQTQIQHRLIGPIFSELKYSKKKVFFGY